MARFAFLVIGDTQYLFDGARRRPDLLAQTFSRAQTLVRACQAGPVVHVVHVGDVTEHGAPQECEDAARVLVQGCLTLRAGATVVAGNHDIDQATDDSRGMTAFLKVLGPQGTLYSELARAGAGGEVLVGPGGYSSWQEVAVVDGEETVRIGVLALDWRPSQETARWAQRLLETRSDLPTVVVTHDVALHRRDASGTPAGPGELTANGQWLSRLLKGRDQVFLVLGGHEWPSTRVRLDGLEVHAVNYQDLPYGGAGAARLYCVDTERGQCEVIAFSPGCEDGAVLASVAARRALALARPEDQFRFDLPASLGGGSRPWQAEGLELVLDEGNEDGLGPQELELELRGRHVIELSLRLPGTSPASWQVALCRLAADSRAPDGSPEPLAALSLSTENFLGWQAYLAAPSDSTKPGERVWAETWQTSHELEVGAQVTVVVGAGGGEATARACGLWVDGDRVGRDDGQTVLPLLPGPWRWRLGAGEYDGEAADDFAGTITRMRVWVEREGHRGQA
ncbi:MAG: metallophosphoesterase [Actinomyces urogenitalis]|uniref:metallophosphoesterase n=1 Tax=Actinomyces urogenitalis TaxID=103621 RepID=UPI002A834559|nr:metallophosphoesterase [Actinomyces urogenitalis]MDY3677639.1 metallophosphoesterase [Actinomyces urogenitalis]